MLCDWNSRMEHEKSLTRFCIECIHTKKNTADLSYFGAQNGKLPKKDEKKPFLMNAHQAKRPSHSCISR